MTDAGLNRLADGSNDEGAAGEGQNLVAPAGQAVEGVAGESKRCIGRYPVSAAAAAFAGGVLGGWLAGRLISRGPKRRTSARVRRGPRGASADKEAILKWEDEGGSVLSASKKDGEK
jgi:hypothetical protein